MVFKDIASQNQTRQMNEPVLWRPNPGPQTDFLSCSAYEMLYGGAAGGGKTDSLVVGPMRWVGDVGFNAIIFRRTFPELEGQVIPRSRAIYPAAGGVYNSVQHCWTFPSGARIHFGHLQHEDDVYKYQGWEFQYIGFDELTQFTEKQYVYLLSRARSVHGIPIRIRATSNPGGIGHEWVQTRWAPWLDRDTKGPRAAPGEVLWYFNEDAGPQWCDPSHCDKEGVSDALGRVFIPAKASDNTQLMASDPGYAMRLGGLDAVTRAQLRDGDWMIRPAAGLYFRRAWFKWLDVAPRDTAERVRRWDLASTTKKQSDWTVGVRMARLNDGKYVVEDVVRGKMRPSDVQKTILSTAEMDGRDVRIVIPQDPGQAGVDQCEAYSKLLVGYNIRFERETGDKVTRAQPFSAQCEAGNVVLIRGPWNEPFLQALEAFPEDGMHDDDVDASAGAFNAIARQYVTLGEGPVTAGDRRTATNRVDEDEDGERRWR